MFVRHPRFIRLIVCLVCLSWSGAILAQNSATPPTTIPANPTPANPSNATAPAAPAVSATPANPVSGSQAVMPYPMAEQYLPEGRVDDYIKDASKFIAANPKSQFVPRLALDLFMLGTINRNADLINRIKLLILFDHSTSLPAAHIVSTEKDANSYRSFLSAVATQQAGKLSLKRARQFMQAIRLGVKYQGAAVLDTPHFLLQAAALARFANDDRIYKGALSRFQRQQNLSDDFKRLAGIAFGEANKDNPKAKVMALHKFPNHPTARFLESHFLNTLSNDQRKDPAIMLLMAENELQRRDFAAALYLLEKIVLPAEEARIDLLSAWCQIGMDNRRSATEILAKLKSEHAGDPWAALAPQIEAAITNLDHNRKHYAGGHFAIVRKLRDGVGQLQLRAQINQGDDLVKFIVQVVPEDKFMQIMINRNGEVRWAYETTGDSSRLYVKTPNEQLIQEFSTPSMVPVPTLRVTTTGRGLNISPSVQLVPSLDKSAAMYAQMFTASPLLATAEGHEEMIDRIVKTGQLPAPTTKTPDGHLVFNWIRPSLDEPKMSTVSYTLRPDHTLGIIRTDKFVAELTYGDKGGFEFSPLEWPAVQSVKRDQMDAAALIQLVTQIVSLFSS